MEARKSTIPPHASAELSTPSDRFPPAVEKLFWPIAAALFFGIVLAEAGVGWAAAILQLLTSGSLLIVWLLAGYGWGVIPRSLFRVIERSALVRVTTLAVGLGMVSLLVLGLGLLGWMNQPMSHLILILGVGVSGYRIVRQRRSIHASVPAVQWWWLLSVPLAAFTITAAMLPAGLLWGMDEPNAYDVIEYHLQAPREWFEAGKIVPLTHNVFSFFPFNVEMHYLLAMHTMGGPWAAQFLAQMMHAAYIGLTVAAVYAAVAERGRFAAIMAATLTASTPWMPMLGSIAYDEGGMLLYGTLAIAWALRALNPLPNTFGNDEGLTPSPGTPGEGRGEGSARIFKSAASSQHNPHPAVSRRTGRGLCTNLAITGVMSGFACGSKLTAVPILLVGVPVAVTAVLIFRGGFFAGPAIRKWLTGMLLSLAAGLLIFSPWMVRNIAWMKNPVFPEMQTAIGRGYFSQEQSDRFYKAHKPRPDQQAASVRVAELGRQVFADWRFGYLLIPIATIATLVTIRRPESQFLLLMLLGLTAFWLIETHLQGRFYVMAIPIAAIAIGLAIVPQHDQTKAILPLGLMLLTIGLAIAGFVAVQCQLNAFAAQFAERAHVDLMQAIGVTGIDSSGRYVEQLPDTPSDIVLVGDATAFSYHVPMSRLHYRTVFDADTSDGRSAIDAWTADVPKDRSAMLWIDPGELDRFHRTYGTPPLGDDVPGPRDRPFTLMRPAQATSPAPQH